MLKRLGRQGASYIFLVIAILCALSGIVAFALPVPGIIARFQDEQEQVS